MAKSLDQMVTEAVAMLPASGQSVEFDTYKANLYAANPNNGRDVFSHLIRQGVVNKKLSRNSNGEMVVLLSRKS